MIANRPLGLAYAVRTTMELSTEASEQLASIFETGMVPPDHFLAFADWSPLIYGADGPQRIYLDVLLDWQGDHQHRDVARFPKANHPFVANYYIDWTDRASIDDSGLRRKYDFLWDVQDRAVIDREKTRRSFALSFNASHSQLGDMSPNALASNERRAERVRRGILKDNPGLDPQLATMQKGDFDNQIRQFAVRRACKFLIYDGIKNNRVIAYALDDLDMKDVVEPIARELDTPGRFKVPVCTSELREIFRRWDYCQTHVRFFEDMKMVNPPWQRVQDIPGWAKYAATRATKLAKALGEHHTRFEQLMGVQVIFEKKAYNEAIKAFHDAKPSELAALPNAVWEL